MSVKQMGLVWELDLPKTEKLVLLALADHADHYGNGARPGVELLAWKVGADRRTIQRTLRSLETLRLVEVVHSGGGLRGGPGHGRRGFATVYRLTLENGVKLPPFTLASDAGEVIPSESTRAAPGARKGGTDDREQRRPRRPNRPEPSRTVSRGQPGENSGETLDNPLDLEGDR